MAALKNPRHERFAQELAKGKPAVEAFEAARYTAAWAKQNAYRLTENDGIQARVRELQNVGAQRAAVTLEGHLAMLAALRDRAAEAGQYGAAIQAEQARGRAAGLYVDRKETAHKAQLIVKDLTKQLGEDRSRDERTVSEQ